MDERPIARRTVPAYGERTIGGSVLVEELDVESMPGRPQGSHRSRSGRVSEVEGFHLMTASSPVRRRTGRKRIDTMNPWCSQSSEPSGLRSTALAPGDAGIGSGLGLAGTRSGGRHPALPVGVGAIIGLPKGRCSVNRPQGRSAARTQIDRSCRHVTTRTVRWSNGRHTRQSAGLSPTSTAQHLPDLDHGRPRIPVYGVEPSTPKMQGCRRNAAASPAAP